MTAQQGSNGNNLNDQWRLKVGLAEMLKGGVIMDVVNAEQAVVAQKAGACAVMALERVPSDIRRDGGAARGSAYAAGRGRTAGAAGHGIGRISDGARNRARAKVGDFADDLHGARHAHFARGAGEDHENIKNEGLEHG